MTKKKHEELVEEIAEELADYYVEENGIGLAFVIPHGQHWPLLRRIIAIILSAVRDGRLDEELGVVGRWNWPTIEKLGPGVNNWIDWATRNGMRSLIALRGTGKEEEK